MFCDCTRAFIFKTIAFPESSPFWRLATLWGRCIIFVTGQQPWSNIFCKNFTHTWKAKEKQEFEYSHFSGTATSRCVLQMSTSWTEAKTNMDCHWRPHNSLKQLLRWYNSIITFCTQHWANFWVFYFFWLILHELIRTALENSVHSLVYSIQ